MLKGSRFGVAPSRRWDGTDSSSHPARDHRALARGSTRLLPRRHRVSRGVLLVDRQGRLCHRLVAE